MAKKDLTEFKGISFDIIGTLVDYEAGVLAWCRPRLPKELTDNQILESFARVEKELHVRLPTRVSFTAYETATEWSISTAVMGSVLLCCRAHQLLALVIYRCIRLISP